MTESQPIKYFLIPFIYTLLVAQLWVSTSNSILVVLDVHTDFVEILNTEDNEKSQEDLEEEEKKEEIVSTDYKLLKSKDFHLVRNTLNLNNIVQNWELEINTPPPEK